MLCVYIYIYIYREREGEGKREIHVNINCILQIYELLALKNAIISKQETKRNKTCQTVQ